MKKEQGFVPGSVPKNDDDINFVVLQYGRNSLSLAVIDLTSDNNDFENGKGVPPSKKEKVGV